MKSPAMDLNFDKILKEANDHKGYQLFTYDSVDLPRLDDVSQYDVNEDSYNQLLSTEIKRLIGVAQEFDSCTFRSDGLLGEITKKTYKELSDLIEQIQLSIDIVNLDNTAVIFENCAENGVITMSAQLMKTSYDSLHLRYKDTAAVRIHPPKLLSPPDRNRKLYFKMVDFITAICIRVLFRAAGGGKWTISTVALFAKLAVKLKVLASDSASYAIAALDRADYVLAEFDQQNDPRAVIILNSYAEDTGKEEEKHITFSDDPHTLTSLYFAGAIAMRLFVQTLFSGGISVFQTHSNQRKSQLSMDVCTISFETGLERTPVIISQDRSGHVATTASQHENVLCQAALELLRLNYTELEKTPPPSNNSVESEPVYVTVDWLPEGAEGARPQLSSSIYKMRNTDDLISTLVPLELSNPKYANTVEAAITQSNWIDDAIDPVKWHEQPKFQARCCIQSQFYIDEHRMFSKQHKDAVPISQSGLIKSLRPGTLIGASWKFAFPHGPLSSSSSEDMLPTAINLPESKKTLDEYRKYEKQMAQWIFNADSVIVNCRGYVFTVLVVCTLLICGALAIPFAVGSRVDGVDPFNITLFAWLVVGVILIAAKGRYVTEWPWHDFIHGRVVCSSISDLAEVSRVSKQIILAKLLSNEGSLRLKTMGPFNGMFNLRLGKEVAIDDKGFSIDEPVRMSTMIASGFLILKVVSELGEHLICLDVRKKRTDYANPKANNLRYLSCLDLPTSSPKEASPMNHKAVYEGRPVVFLSENCIGWIKLVGLYVDNVAFG